MTQLVTTVAPVAVPVTDPSGNPVTGKIFSLILFKTHSTNYKPNHIYKSLNSFIDASGNPVTETVISVTDSSGNLVTGDLFFSNIAKII